MIKIALVDDHQIIIDGLKSLLNQSSTIQLVATANSGKEILQKINETVIDILITDISMPEMNGLELAKKVKQLFPEIKIIALSMNADGSTINAMVNDADITGYLLKQTGANELITAIEKVYKGGIYFQTDILNALEQQTKIKQQQVSANLSNREIQIIALLEKDFSNKQIATELNISVRTVETHRKNILRKTNTNNLLSLIKWAYANKVLQ
ncbi:MAG: response regulator transcription factor [Bacteroidetes bacterium]|nr:response regulator transcription factor [Bacteroidota bacterium]MBS1638840.1 response regulator transcription factor [Bacteroidota bacterium]MBS1648570.1 response regulator transcription factor [Bacteroidota bacterium]